MTQVWLRAPRAARASDVYRPRGGLPLRGGRERQRQVDADEKACLGLISPLAGTIDCPAQRAGAIGYLPQQTSAQRFSSRYGERGRASGFCQARAALFSSGRGEERGADEHGQARRAGAAEPLPPVSFLRRTAAAGRRARPCARRTACSFWTRAGHGSRLPPPRRISLKDPALPQRKKRRWRSSWSRTICEALLRAHDPAHIGRDGWFFGTVAEYLIPRRQAVLRCIVSLLLECSPIPLSCGPRRGHPVCLRAALLGVLPVLKRYSMIGDGLSHVSFWRAGRRGSWLRWRSLCRSVAFGLPVAAHRGALCRIGRRRHRGCFRPGARHRHRGHEPHHGHDHTDVDSYIARQPPASPRAPRRRATWRGCCRAGALYPLLPSALCRHV